jgi:hypothetical protein
LLALICRENEKANKINKNLERMASNYKKKVKNRNWKRIHRVCIIRIPKERQTSGEIYFLKCKSRKEIMLEATDSKWYTSW